MTGFGRAGRHSNRGTVPAEEVERLTLTARVDQVLALVAERAKANSNNRDLVDLALDVRNILTPQPQEAPK